MRGSSPAGIKWVVDHGAGVVNRPDSYGTLAGTSRAAPQGAGAVASLLGGGYTPLAAIDRLLRTADPVGCPTASPTRRGRINLAEATAE